MVAKRGIASIRVGAFMRRHRAISSASLWGKGAGGSSTTCAPKPVERDEQCRHDGHTAHLQEARDQNIVNPVGWGELLVERRHQPGGRAHEGSGDSGGAVGPGTDL